MVTLEQLVPKNHLVRQIDAAIDFEFIRDEVAHRYCHNNDRPAIDPVRLFKILLLGFLFGVKSERHLVKDIEVNVAYRWFLRMSLSEKVIDASTLSQNRRRRFNDTDVFERIFIRIVEQAMNKGMVDGRVLFTDSTHLKANANKSKYSNELTTQNVSVKKWAEIKPAYLLTSSQLSAPLSRTPPPCSLRAYHMRDLSLPRKTPRS